MRLILLCLLVLPRLAWGYCDVAAYEDRLPQAARAALEAQARAEPFAEGLLWQATRGESHAVIAGTIHLPHPRATKMADRLRPHLRRADLLLVEATLADLHAAERAFLAEPDFAMMTDATLPELLDEPTWQRLIPALAARGMPAVLGSRLEPWAAALVLASAPCMSAALTRGGLDTTLMTQADTADIPIRAIEDWRSTLVRLRQPSRAQDIKMLRVALDAEGDANALAATTLRAYADGLTGRALTVERHAAKQQSPEALALTDAMIRRLLDERNAEWLAPIDAASAEAPRLLIAVGAAHLPGDNGLLALMAARGWTITPLP